MRTIYYITSVLFIVSLLSCKTQKRSIQSEPKQINKTVIEIDKIETEQKPKAVTPGMINGQKVNDLAEKKATLLCSLKELKLELEKANDENHKAEINAQVEQLKNEIKEFDAVIEATFPDRELVEEVDKKVSNIVKGC